MSTIVATPNPDRRELGVTGRCTVDAHCLNDVLTVPSKHFAVVIAAMFETDHEATVDAIASAVIDRAPPNRK